MPTLATFLPSVKFREISAEEIPQAISAKELTWVNCVGLSDEEIIKVIKSVKEIPDFLIEDCTVSQRPKLDDYDKLISIIFKIIKFKEMASTVQLNMIFGKNYLLTICKENHPVFDQIRARLEKHEKRARSLGVGFVAYSILESIADTYFPIVERVDDMLEETEGKLLKANGIKYIKQILNLRKVTLRLRRNFYPEKEILRTLGRDRYRPISEGSMVYFRDTFSDLLSLSERIDNQREHLSSLMEIYTTTVSNNLNIIVKTLTVITALILVPGFIAGLYGMNVKLPYADSDNAFPLIMGFIIFVAISMVIVFRAKKWI